MRDILLARLLPTVIFILSACFAHAQSDVTEPGSVCAQSLASLSSTAEEDPEQWIQVDLVQDQSHLESLPKIPGFLLTIVGRKAFNAKIKTLIDDGRPKNELPKLTKMYFGHEAEENNGIIANKTVHTHIRLKVKDLPVVIDWFIKTMNHPALGNKVFKISRI